MERGRLGLTASPPASTVRVVASWLFGVSVLWTIGCFAAPVAPTDASTALRLELRDGWLAMGTFFEVDLRVPMARSAAAEQWVRFARDESMRLEKIYSRHDPQSELSSLNRGFADSAESTTRASLSPELAELITTSERLRSQTRGSFDIAVGPLVELWTSAAVSGRLPSQAALDTRLEEVAAGHRSLEGQDFPTSTRPRGGLDLDAISKGAVLDRLAANFSQHFPDGAALLSLGQSSIRAIGDPEANPPESGDPDCGKEGRGWRLVIRSRDPERGRLGEVRLCDRALSMSSSLGSVLEIEGQRWSHVIDPRSGRPVEGSFEAIVIAESAARADAWSTALLVWGGIPDREQGSTSADLEIWLMDAAGRRFQTEGWPGVEN
jgi:thiamine biosynthesis lipoprotein